MVRSMVRSGALALGIAMAASPARAERPVELAALGTDPSTTVEVSVQAPDAKPFSGKGARLAAPSRAAGKRDRLDRRYRYRRNEFSPLIERYAAANDVPAEFAHAIVEIESRFRPNVRGRAGEIGLMQIKPATARLVGFRGPAKALYDPETNIKYGMRYLAKARKLGDKSVCGTILKYNAGHAARKMNRISRAYCDKVKGVLARNAERYELESLTAYAYLDAPKPRFRAFGRDAE